MNVCDYNGKSRAGAGSMGYWLKVVEVLLEVRPILGDLSVVQSVSVPNVRPPLHLVSKCRGQNWLARGRTWHIQSIPHGYRTSSYSYPTQVPLPSLPKDTSQHTFQTNLQHHTCWIFWSCRSYRVCVNAWRPNDAPTMSTRNGTPNNAGFFFKRLCIGEFSGLDWNVGIAKCKL